MCASKNPKRSDKGLGLYSGARIKDYLDRISLDFIEEKSFEGVLPVVIEFGCGAGTHTVRMAQMGAHVVGVDIDVSVTRDLIKKVSLHKLIDPERIELIEKDWRLLSGKDLPNEIDALFSQRSLSYLSFEQVRALLFLCAYNMKEEALFFVSLNGIESLYGVDHPQRERPVQERFGVLSKKMQKVLNVSNPVCVYDEQDVPLVFEGTGFVIEEIKKTPFGNFQVKGVFKKRI